MTPLQNLAQVFNINSNTYHSVKIEEDVDERKQQGKKPALTSMRDTQKKSYIHETYQLMMTLLMKMTKMIMVTLTMMEIGKQTQNVVFHISE